MITLKHFKQLPEGTIGGIYVEGRPVFGGLKSNIKKCDYASLGDYIVQYVTNELTN